jgi:DNA-binding SARP family transcriptional activator
VIEFRLLGPLELRCGGVAHSVRSHSQAMLLISLLVSEGRQVPAEALIDELWGGGHPADPANALQAHISRLRRLLDGLEPERKVSRLTSQSAGYQLRVSDDELDGHAFLAEVAALPGAAVDLPPAEVAARARQALANWRGPVFGGVVGGAICQAGAARYEMGRYRALEALFEAELGCGNHAAIVPELSALVAAPSLFQERFCEQLMVALYRSGRQADALDLYHRTWSQLASDTKVQPSGRLKAYVRAILEHDPVLAHGGQRRHPHPAGARAGLVRRQPAVAVR